MDCCGFSESTMLSDAPDSTGLPGPGVTSLPPIKASIEILYNYHPANETPHRHNRISKQECIPVGLRNRPACWPYPSMHCGQGGVSPSTAPWVGGVCPGGVCPRGVFTGGAGRSPPPMHAKDRHPPVERQTPVKTYYLTQDFVCGWLLYKIYWYGSPV